MISKAKTVEEFLNTVTDEERAVFAELREQFKADKRVIKSIEYRMPTYKIGKSMVGAFNKQKNYLCLYLNPVTVDPFRKALRKLDCGKSCIRLKKPDNLPLDVAAQIIKAAAKLATE
jgi:uncharacterized protein YdhG (YjbR/CyaY superfamily)